MTSTVRRRRGPSAPAGRSRREFRLYRFHGHDGTLLYIGETGRQPFQRLMEHVCDKPWAPEMARWEVDPRMWATEAEVLAAEEAAIRAERPRYNWEHNEGNPDRVWAPPVQQPRQWRPASRRPTRRVTPIRSGFWGTRLGSWLLDQLLAAAKVAAVWFAVFAGAVAVAEVGAVLVADHLLSLDDTTAAAAVITTLILVKFWPRPKRRRRR